MITTDAVTEALRNIREKASQGMSHGLTADATCEDILRLADTAIAQAADVHEPVAWTQQSQLDGIADDETCNGGMWAKRDCQSVRDLMDMPDMPDDVPLYTSPPVDIAAARRVRHKKRGSTYTVIGTGKIQADSWIDESRPAPVDMRAVTVYRADEDSTLWVRPVEEFDDGRFEELSARPSPSEAVEADMIESGARASYEHWQNIPACVASKSWAENCEKLPGSAEFFRALSRKTISAALAKPS